MLSQEDSLPVPGAAKQLSRISGSGKQNIGVFCPERDVRLYHIPGKPAGMRVLKPGTRDDTRWPWPASFIWTQSTRGWVPVPDGVEALEGRN